MPAAGGLFVAQVGAYTGLCLAMVVLELALAHRGTSTAAPAAKLSDQVMILGTVAALICGLIAAAMRIGEIEPRWIAVLSGVAVGLAGVALRGSAMAALGRSYSLTPQVEREQAIVTTGPYRLVRHPGYAGILLSLLGLQLITGSWMALLFTLFVILPLPVRIRIEEQLMVEQLGRGYEEYARRTPYRLIPSLY